ncbi:unnamed protein product, partial [marine sediment metagenome]
LVVKHYTSCNDVKHKEKDKGVFDSPGEVQKHGKRYQVKEDMYIAVSLDSRNYQASSFCF